MERDLWKYAAIVGGAALIGYSIGYALLTAFLAAVTLVVWQLHRINLIQKWLDDPKAHQLPEMGGLFYLLHKKLTKRNAQYAKRKRQLSSYLSQFRKAVSAMPDAIVLIDNNGKIEWANSNASSLLGIRWPEDGAVRFGDLIRYQEVAAMLADSKRKKETLEINSIAHNGRSINFKSIPYSNTTRMVIARDVSQLIKVNQMHSDFVANVSHELKTPLTVLKGYVEILQGASDLPSKFVKPLEQMNVQSTRMQFIVSDLLYLARLEDKDNVAPHQIVQVTHLVNTIIEAVQPLLEDKRHKIQLDIDHDLCLVGAETELHSAFSNLVTNAINYTEPHGEIGILWKADEEGAIFRVKDNGLGIPAHHLSRLTQRFYRVDTDRSREGGGTGLGLAIVKHVLQRHAGELLISSTEGVGSTFTCHFPNEQVSRSAQKKIS